MSGVNSERVVGREEESSNKEMSQELQFNDIFFDRQIVSCVTLFFARFGNLRFHFQH